MKPRFIADTGTAVPAVTADEMREVDRIATEETGPHLLQMMENAGRTLALRMGIEYVSPFGGRFRVRLTCAGRSAQVGPVDGCAGVTPGDTHA